MPNLLTMQRRGAEFETQLAAIPSVRQVLVVGSVRWMKADPHDLELCALVDPKPSQMALFADLGDTRPEPTTDAIDALLSQYRAIRAGTRYAQFDMGRVGKLDYFQTADPAEFGALVFIRTGPAAWGQAALSNWARLSRGGKMDGNRFTRPDGTAESCPTEDAVYALLGWPYVRPEDRTEYKASVLSAPSQRRPGGLPGGPGGPLGPPLGGGLKPRGSRHDAKTSPTKIEGGNVT